MTAATFAPTVSGAEAAPGVAAPVFEPSTSSAPESSAGPRWSPVDDETHDLLMLVAEDQVTTTPTDEWDFFKRALEEAADDERLVWPNTLRPLVRGRVAPRRIGAFTHRAICERLVEYTGDWQTSDDTDGKNGGKPMRVMRLLSG